MSTEVEYMTPKKEVDTEKLQKAIDSYKFDTISDSLETIGIILGKDGTTPKSAGAPRIFALKDGKAVKITISSYFSPKGNEIHEVGISPDVECELDVEQYLEDGSDNQLERAKEILKQEF